MEPLNGKLQSLHCYLENGKKQENKLIDKLYLKLLPLEQICIKTCISAYGEIFEHFK